MRPVYEKYFADPFVWQAGGRYYAVGTGPRGSTGYLRSGGVFPLLTYTDPGHWHFLGYAMPHLDPGYGDTYWAPEVAEQKGIFYLYYSVGFEDRLHHLRVAVSDTPAGPFEDTGTALTDPFVNPFSIDAHPYCDSDGKWYLFYARDFLDSSRNSRAGTGLVVDRLVDMISLAGEERIVLRPRFDWQRFMKDRVIYGRVLDWHTLEGPCVRRHRRKYYCFFSGGCWKDSTYGVDYAVADNVTGPYSGDTSPPKLLHSSAELIGAGHISLLRGEEEDLDLLIFHAWDQAGENRLMHIAPLRWTKEGPALEMSFRNYPTAFDLTRSSAG